MRLKQTLGILLPLLLLCSVAAAAGTHLTNVGVATQPNATTVTLSATGAFTHTEYRPADNLLLVDLTGVSADKLDGQSRTLNAPGVVSYRVLGYRGANGAEVTRLEITLSTGTEVHLAESEGGLAVRLQVPGSAAVAASMPRAKSSGSSVSAPSAEASHAPAPAKTIQIRKLAMVRGKSGMDLEITATGPLAPKVMKLTGPDRLVLDVTNAIPAAAPHTLAVHGDTVKEVRMARYQTKPPVTRIVVDLAKAQDYTLVPDGNRLTLQLRAVGSAAAEAPSSALAAAPETAPAATAEATAPADTQPAPAAQTAAQATPVPAGAATPAPPAGKASDYLYVEPTVQTKSEGSDTQPAPADATARAADAASKFATPQPEVPLSANASMSPQPAMNLALQQQQQQGAVGGGTPASKPRYTGEPISVNLKDVDIKDFFRLIHDISGLNVVLDPTVHGNLTIVLDDVPWDQALDIVLQNNGLDRQLEGNVLRIATVDTLRKEADAKRAQIEAQRLAVDTVTVTRFLSYAHAEDVVPTIKKFLSQRGDLVADKRTNALIISDIPSVFPQVDALLAKLDRKTQEVEIEARVVAATRNFARDIGTQLGFAWGNASTTVGGAPAPGQASNLLSPAGALLPMVPIPANVAGVGSAIPLFSNLAAGTGQNPATSGLSLTTAGTNYRLDFMLTMAENRGLLKILSRPRIVTQNNIQAVVRQGVRVPIVTAAQLGGPPTVQYVDAFLRLTVTPQITAENTIFLNVDVENTTPDFTREVQGNPTLITQQATTQVLVTDGGTVVIGGVIQTQNQVNISQVPLLGNIPILGNVFKRRTVSTSTQELIFFITPKIIQT